MHLCCGSRESNGVVVSMKIGPMKSRRVRVTMFQVGDSTSGSSSTVRTVNMASIDTSHALKQFDDLVARGELFYTPSKPVIVNDNGLDVSMISQPS